jgi:hypothetical protein
MTIKKPRVLTPYDTGAVLEPRVWSTKIAIAPENWGKVDLENEAGETEFVVRATTEDDIVTLHVTPVTTRHWRLNFTTSLLDTPEQAHYTPFIEAMEDPGRLEVGIKVRLDGGERHEVRLVPSSETTEPGINGNIFLYEDDDALSHVAWSVPDTGQSQD